MKKLSIGFSYGELSSLKFSVFDVLRERMKIYGIDFDAGNEHGFLIDIESSAEGIEFIFDVTELVE